MPEAVESPPCRPGQGRAGLQFLKTDCQHGVNTVVGCTAAHLSGVVDAERRAWCDVELDAGAQHGGIAGSWPISKIQTLAADSNV
ncbi:hypothetical protein [Pararhizobium sp. PWRC1-1]|uniref:hypothetical protein n=1 Tax=Pararhizobium sp. PWRC1-1 TaxID=2804566 RepID=UPI003CEF487F